MPYLNSLPIVMQLPGDSVKLLMGRKAAGKKPGKPQLLILIVAGPRCHQKVSQGSQSEIPEACPRGGGRGTDSHRYFKFPSWKALLQRK